VKPYGCQPACSDPYVDINYDACINDTWLPRNKTGVVRDCFMHRNVYCLL
jgi:hypothetical protein